MASGKPVLIAYDHRPRLNVMQSSVARCAIYTPAFSRAALKERPPAQLGSDRHI